jgi:hypothetical protein
MDADEHPHRRVELDDIRANIGIVVDDDLEDHLADIDLLADDRPDERANELDEPPACDPSRDSELLAPLFEHVTWDCIADDDLDKMMQFYRDPSLETLDEIIATDSVLYEDLPDINELREAMYITYEDESAEERRARIGGCIAQLKKPQERKSRRSNAAILAWVHAVISAYPWFADHVAAPLYVDRCARFASNSLPAYQYQLRRGPKIMKDEYDIKHQQRLWEMLAYKMLLYAVVQFGATGDTTPIIAVVKTAHTRMRQKEIMIGIATHYCGADVVREIANLPADSDTEYSSDDSSDSCDSSDSYDGRTTDGADDAEGNEDGDEDADDDLHI